MWIDNNHSLAISKIYDHTHIAQGQEEYFLSNKSLDYHAQGSGLDLPHKLENDRL